MAAYRRFVAYLYEYRKDKKGVNCGFVRIEAWRNVCRIELHLLCPGLVSGSECSVYGFVRKDESIDRESFLVCVRQQKKRLIAYWRALLNIWGTVNIPWRKWEE